MCVCVFYCCIVMADLSTLQRLQRRVGRPLTAEEAHGNLLGSGGTRDKRGFLCARGGQIVEGALSAQGYARLAALRDADPAYTVRYTLQDHTFSDLASVAKFLVAKDQETQRAAREKAYASAQPCAYAQYVAPATPCDAEPLLPA